MKTGYTLLNKASFRGKYNDRKIIAYSCFPNTRRTMNDRLSLRSPGPCKSPGMEAGVHESFPEVPVQIYVEACTAKDPNASEMHQKCIRNISITVPDYVSDHESSVSECGIPEGLEYPDTRLNTRLTTWYLRIGVRVAYLACKLSKVTPPRPRARSLAPV